MDRFNSMAIFIEVVEQESFTAAADKIGLSRAQISKSVMQLEEHLGTRLLNRTTRSISLTDTGRIFYERCKAILQDVDELEGLAREQTRKPRGTLAISAPTSFSILYLKDLIPQFLTLYPEVQISLNLSDRFVDVIAEGFDVVIRIAGLEDSSLISRKIAPCKRIFCASPNYLLKHAPPKVPKDLSGHSCLIFSNEMRPDNWTLYGSNGQETIKVSGPICANNGDILKEAAAAGLGITLLPTFIVGPDIKAGRLQQVLPDYCPPEIAISAVFPSKRFLSAKVRAFVDFLHDYFGDKPDWDKFG